MASTEMRETRKLELEDEDHELKKRRIALHTKILYLDRKKIEIDASERRGKRKKEVNYWMFKLR